MNRDNKLHSGAVPWCINPPAGSTCRHTGGQFTESHMVSTTLLNSSGWSAYTWWEALFISCTVGKKSQCTSPTTRHFCRGQTSPSRLCSSTHQHFGVCMVPDLIHSIPRGAVHPGLRSIQHGDGHGEGQQVDPLQHGPLRPTQRLWHGPETHLSAGWGNRKGGQRVGRRLAGIMFCAGVMAHLGVCALQW